MQAALFITCLCDLFYPDVGRSTARMLARLGVGVTFPERQTCCGQPGFTTGFQPEALAVARANMRAFRDAEYVVVPSGSCAAMVRHYYPILFSGQRDLDQAEAFADRLYEFAEFLVDVLGVEDLGGRFKGRVAYHPSCHMLRGLGVREAPLRLLASIADLELVEPEEADDCCGFGGTFAVKMGEVSGAMVDRKVDRIVEAGVDALVSCDMGCLMNIQGRLERRRADVRTLHLAELLEQALVW